MLTDPVLEQEHLLLDVTEMIVELMNAQGVTRSELADRLGKTKGHVTQLLNGSRNLTLRTLSDIFVALEFRFLPTAMPIAEPYSAYLHSRPENGLRFSTSKPKKTANRRVQTNLANTG
jgi:transcriptional regulator with XRE-family HTH domain